MILKRLDKTNTYSNSRTYGVYLYKEDMNLPDNYIDTIEIFYDKKKFIKDVSEIDYATFYCNYKAYHRHYSYKLANGKRVNKNKYVLQLFPKNYNDLVILKLDLNLGG